MKRITLIQALFLVLTLPLSYLFLATQSANSYAFGCGTIFLNFVLLWMGWSLIFKKKLVAVSISIIVFKYAILGIIVFRIANQPWLDPLWFCLGIASFVVTSLLYAISKALSEGKENVV